MIPPLPLHKQIPFQKEAFALLLSFRYVDGRPLAQHSFFVLLNQEKVLIELNEQGHSQTLWMNQDNRGTLIINHCEMIHHQTGYPTHKQIFYLQDFEGTSTILEILVLFPPIIVDLSQTTALTAPQLNYFIHNGNNVLLFIHGYNTLLGNFGCYPESYDIEQRIALSEPQFKNEHAFHSNLIFKKSQDKRTIYCNLSEPNEICLSFPELSLCYNHYFSHHRAEFNPEGLGEHHAILNGTGACQWFSHMEYHFNRAAGFYKNYQDYTRILGIHWPSGNGLTDFKEAERLADHFAEALYLLIEQLINTKLQIHIIAHSLGCRVALQMMKALITQGKAGCIEHTLFWQAALPNTALTSEPLFEEAYQSAKKITILYSVKDTILQTLYSSTSLNAFSFHQALGYAGIKRDDPLARSLLNSGRLINVDQSPYLLGHSYMKVPSKTLMQEIFQDYIIGGQFGIRRFGTYSLA